MIGLLIAFIKTGLFGLLLNDNIIKTGLLCILLNDYLKRNYPERYNEVLITASFELIHFYSKGQIVYKKFITQLKTVIDANPQLKKIINDIYKKNVQRNEIYQIKKDAIHIKYYTDNNETYFEPDKNSIYLFSDNENAIEHNCANRIILHSQPFSGKYEVSNVQFMLVEVKINDVAYKINLKTDKFNYYIVDNIFDLKFFKYYFYNYQVCKLTTEEKDAIDKIVVKIIDQNVNTREFEISDDKFIIIKKDDYIY
jgi:hypothetical protein